MLTTIEGTYNDGQIILDEVPSVQKRMKVIVTFLEEATESNREPLKGGIQFGSLAGKLSVPIDFNEPLDDLNEYM